MNDVPIELEAPTGIEPRPDRRPRMPEPLPVRIVAIEDVMLVRLNLPCGFRSRFRGWRIAGQIHSKLPIGPSVRLTFLTSCTPLSWAAV